MISANLACALSLLSPMAPEEADRPASVLGGWAERVCVCACAQAVSPADRTLGALNAVDAGRTFAG